MNYSAIVITLSDRASQGEYNDISGKALQQILVDYFVSVQSEIDVRYHLIPDDANQLKVLVQEAVHNETNFIFTNGGTGIGPRDITPDVIKPLLDKEIPGIMELIRIKYGLQFPSAALSRSIAGVSKNSLVYCLPGNPKAVREYMEEILKTLLHTYRMLKGIPLH